MLDGGRALLAFRQWLVASRHSPFASRQSSKTSRRTRPGKDNQRSMQSPAKAKSEQSGPYEVSGEERTAKPKSLPASNLRMVRSLWRTANGETATSDLPHIPS